jgi:hypothetical protein
MTTTSAAAPQGEDTAQPVALHEVARRVRRLQRHIEDWAKWYGDIDVLVRNPLPLPPAGTLKLLEDLDDAMARCDRAGLVPPAAPQGEDDRATFEPDEKDRTPDNDCVICPKCTHQFGAIPVNVQARLAAAEGDAERYRWLRDVGTKTWVPLQQQWRVESPSDCDRIIDAARHQTGEQT